MDDGGDRVGSERDLGRARWAVGHGWRTAGDGELFGRVDSFGDWPISAVGCGEGAVLLTLVDVTTRLGGGNGGSESE